MQTTDTEETPDQQLRELKRSLRALASAGLNQPALFPDVAPSASHLVSDFDNRVSVVRQALDGQLSPLQEESVAALEDKLATMSRDGAEFDADVWTETAVRTSEHWSDVRRLAEAALDVFDEAAD